MTTNAPMSGTTGTRAHAGPSTLLADLAKPTAAYRRHAWAAVIALVGFLVAYLGLAGWFLHTAYKLTFGAHAGSSSGWGWLVAVCAAFLAVFMLKALFFVKAGQMGRELELKRADQPRLFEDLDRLADRAGAPRPHRVFLTPRVNASVFYDLTVLNLLFPSRKNLEIGLGLVNALTLGELHAVLAHEFGHFAQRSMAVGRWAYVAQQIAGHLVARRDGLDDFLRALSRIDFRIAWIGWILSVIVWAIRSLVDLAYRGVELIQRALSREMELQADLVAVSLTGSDALIHALHKLQAADDSWDRTLGFVGGEHEKRRGTLDAFAVQTRVLQRMGRVLNDPNYHRAPEVPIERPEAHRVFRAEWAQPPQMWLTHPMNHVREENAKRRYVPAEIDPRSAWVLFENPQALREQVTARMINDDDLPRVPIEESLQTVDEQFSRETLRGQYRGVYLGRSVTRHADDHDALCDSLTMPDRSVLGTLYPESLLAEMERWRGLERELGQLRALQAGHLAASGGTIRFRGEALQAKELPRVIGEVEAECREVEGRLQAHDKQCRSLHRALARQLGGDHEARLTGLLALVHYAEHSEANIRDLQAVLASAWRVESASRRVGEDAVKRLVREANNLQDAMERLHRQQRDVKLDAPLRQRLGGQDWPQLLGDFGLPTANPNNLGEWLKVVDGWVNQFANAFSRLKSAALDELLAAEMAVARPTAGSVPAVAEPADAASAEPAAPAAPVDYPVLLRGQERERRTKLSWWARFQSAEGLWPTLARLGVAGSIVVGVLGFSSTVGDAEIKVYNGLGTTVVAQIGGQSVTVGPRSSRQVTVPADAHYQVEARLPDGTPIESFDASADAGSGHYVYSVAGAAALVEWTVGYGMKGHAPDHAMGAPRWFTSNADVLFAEPPKSVNSKGPTTRRVLSALAEGPDQELGALKDDKQRLALVELHARWDDSHDKQAAQWMQAASVLPNYRDIIATRLKRAPHDVLLLRAEQDAAGDQHDAVCARHTAQSAAQPQQPGLRYAAVRCLTDERARDDEFIEGHSRWPKDGWFAYAAGHSEAERGHFSEALVALAQARKTVPELAEIVAVDESRLQRYLHPQDPNVLVPLAQQSRTLRNLLALERGELPYAPDADFPKEYGELARGNLPAAQRATAKNPERANRLRWLLAASDGAPSEWAEQALAAAPNDALDGSTLFAAVGLALRHGKDPSAYLAKAGLRGNEQQPMLQFIELLRRRGNDLGAADKLLMQMPIELRARACSVGVIALGKKAPRAWREMASRMLFASERPYFAT